MSAVRHVDTPLGTMALVASSQGLTRISFLVDRPHLIECAGDGGMYLDETERWISAYFSGRRSVAPKLDLSGLTAFQARVCTALMDCGFGEKTTYGELASAVGSPGASRAVGSVMAMNPWPLLVPCHRVLQSGGGLGNYSACDGPKTKQWLLDFESEF